MSDEYDISLYFPKYDKVDTMREMFSLNHTARDIIDFACKKSSFVLPTSEVYINSKNGYELVSPDTKVTDIGQHAVYICPEQFRLTIKMKDGDSETDISVHNSYILSDILRYYCVTHHLLDPMFYAAKAKSKVLDQTLTLVEQDPFASEIIIESIDLKSKTEILTKYFSEHDNLFNEKDYPRIASSAYFALNGPYTTSMQEGYLRKRFIDILPKSATSKEKLIEKSIKYYKEISAKETNVDGVMNDICTKIMDRRSFMSQIYQKVNIIKGVVDSKQTSFSNCTLCLKYSSLTIYTRTDKVMDEIYLSDVERLENEMNYSIKFIHNKDGKNYQVRITTEVASQIKDLFDTIKERKRKPSGSPTRSRTSEQETNLPGTPIFAQIFYIYENVPKSEILYILSYLSNLLIDKYRGDIDRMTTSEDETIKKLSNLYLSVSIYRTVNDGIGGKLMDAVDKLRNVGEEIVQLASKIDENKKTIKKSRSKDANEKLEKQNKDLEEQLKKKEALFKGFRNDFNTAYKTLVDDSRKIQAQKSSLNLRDPPVSLIRFSLMLLFLYYWSHQISYDKSRKNKDIHLSNNIEDNIKKLIERIKNDYKDIYAYTTDKNVEKFNSIYDDLTRYSNLISADSSGEKSVQPLKFLSEEVKTIIKKEKKSITEKYKSDLVVLLPELSNKSIKRIPPEDFRKRVNRCDSELRNLESTANTSSLKESNAILDVISRNMIRILGMIEESHRDAPISAFNELKREVENNFVTNGNSLTSLQSCTKRLNEAIHDIKKSLDPSESLRKRLEPYPNNEIVVLLRKIIDYLEKNGPLHKGSKKDNYINEFISKMQHSKPDELESLAKVIVEDLPDFKELIDKCDPTKGKHDKLDTNLSIDALTNLVKQSSEEAHKSAINLRKSVRNLERNSSQLYQILSSRLWRVMNIFTQFSKDELPESVGKATFDRCKKCFKYLIEEAAVDMKRDREYHDTFIKTFISKLNPVIEAPRSPQALTDLGEFLKDNQMKAGFYDAAEAIFNFIEFLLESETNKACQVMIDRLKAEIESKKRQIIFTSIMKRIERIIEMAHMPNRVNFKPGVTNVDLRQDFLRFMIKFEKKFDLIYDHLKSEVRRPDSKIEGDKFTKALVSIQTAIEALEKLLVLINITDLSTTYFARSVCAIISHSMEEITTLARQPGKATNKHFTEVILAIREFLFHIRRKIAEGEKKSLLKNGIGIDDMMAVVKRERVQKAKIHEFQSEIRRRLWDPDFYDFDDIRTKY